MLIFLNDEGFFLRLIVAGIYLIVCLLIMTLYSIHTGSVLGRTISKSWSGGIKRNPTGHYVKDPMTRSEFDGSDRMKARAIAEDFDKAGSDYQQPDFTEYYSGRKRVKHEVHKPEVDKNSTTYGSDVKICQQCDLPAHKDDDRCDRCGTKFDN
jgi:hypothetical protein